MIPSYDDLLARTQGSQELDPSKRNAEDLDVITSISAVQVRDALSSVLRALDKAGLVNQRGYEILIQVLALKIFDEKRNLKSPGYLAFCITPDERDFDTLAEPGVQAFIKRIRNIQDEAMGTYGALLSKAVIDWKDIDHVRAVVAACESFQDFSFVRSTRSDLYQLVFYNFANEFQQQEKAQFLTPLAVIDFLVKLVNPRDGDSVFDPCCGIGDFLSLSYVNAQEKQAKWRLDDANIYGADISSEMITLASLNMLLNGDGNAHLYRVPDKGSIVWKIRDSNPPTPVELLPKHHKAGDWDTWPDKTKLLKFDVILTNPPFGEDRAYRPQADYDRSVIEMYETWELSGGDTTDLGVVFLENAYRCLKENGRVGIVLSNSIASIDGWRKVRAWFMQRMRIVALFDLPANVFAETGVNTTLLVAYRSSGSKLKALQEQNYSVFVRDIQRMGYEKRTSKRNVFFNPKYRVDEETFEIAVDDDGSPILDEDFSETLVAFREWALGQEQDLQKLFLEE